MGKKSLYAAIILISLAIFFTLLPAGGNSFSGEFYLINILIFFIIFSLPLLIGGIFLLRKHFRTKNIIPSNSQNKDQFKSSKNAEFKFQTTTEQPPSPQSEGKTQFWVCPVCNGDFKDVDGKSYCQNCERYF